MKELDRAPDQGVTLDDRRAENQESPGKERIETQTERASLSESHIPEHSLDGRAEGEDLDGPRDDPLPRDGIGEPSPNLDEGQELTLGGAERPQQESGLVAPAEHFAFALGDSARVTRLGPGSSVPEREATSEDMTQRREERASPSDVSRETAAPIQDREGRGRDAGEEIEPPAYDVEIDGQGYERPLTQSLDNGLAEPVNGLELPVAGDQRAVAEVAHESPGLDAPESTPALADGLESAGRVVGAGLEIAGKALETVGDLFEGLMDIGSAPPAPPTPQDIQMNQAQIEDRAADDRAARIAARAAQLRQDIENHQRQQERDHEEGLASRRAMGRERDF